MVLVEVDSMMVHTTGVTATTRMLPVLAFKQKFGYVVKNCRPTLA